MSPIPHDSITENPDYGATRHIETAARTAYLCAMHEIQPHQLVGMFHLNARMTEEPHDLVGGSSFGVLYSPEHGDSVEYHKKRLGIERLAALVGKNIHEIYLISYMGNKGRVKTQSFAYIDKDSESLIIVDLWDGEKGNNKKTVFSKPENVCTRNLINYSTNVIPLRRNGVFNSDDPEAITSPVVYTQSTSKLQIEGQLTPDIGKNKQSNDMVDKMFSTYRMS